MEVVGSSELSVSFLWLHSVFDPTINQSFFGGLYTLTKSLSWQCYFFYITRVFFFPLPVSSLLSLLLLFAWSGCCHPKRFNGLVSSVHKAGAKEMAESCHCLLPTGRDNQLLSRPWQDNNTGVSRSSHLIHSLREEGVALTTLCERNLLLPHIYLFLDLYHNGNTNISSINQLQRRE
jgi:hypothetical protein